MDEEKEGFFFVNLVDFDMLYGHRNDALGYGKALESFDNALGEMLPRLKESDLMMVVADHGNDPTSASTDHNREYVPILMAGGGVKDLGTRKTMADIGATAFTALTGETLSELPGECML